MDEQEDGRYSMRRSIVLILLGLMMATAAWAQTDYSVRVGLNRNGVRFKVDGQEYQSMQNFIWPEGSRHVVEYLYNLDENNQVTPYQFADGHVARYSFSGWHVTGPNGQPASEVNTNGDIVEFFVQPGISAILGSVTIEYLVYLDFVPNLPENASVDDCSATPQDPPQDFTRAGVVTIDDTCYDRTDHEVWLAGGQHTLSAFAYIGWVFEGWFFDSQTPPSPYTTTVNIVASTTLKAIFTRAKRVQFASSPLGLKIVVDRAIIATPPEPPIRKFADYIDSACTPDYTRLPSNPPLGFTPLCLGTYDFIPGSQHHLAAPESQMDSNGNYWVFNGFDNGMGQNAVYTAGTDVNQVDVVTAKFVRGVYASVITNVSELNVFVDGRNNWPGPGQNFIWGVGQPHTVSAPSQLTGSDGRVYEFVNWSDGGAPEHSVVVPAGSQGFALTANYKLLGQVQVTSTPSGVTMQVDGNTCVTPCTFNRAPGATLSVTTPNKVTQSDAARYDFFGWVNRDNKLSQTITFDGGVQKLHAVFRGAYLLTVQTDPANASMFTFSPTSPDGFYSEGTSVNVTVNQKSGYKFQAWGGDGSGTNPTLAVTMNAPHHLIAYFKEVPVIYPAGIRNAAGETPDKTVAPGSIITIYGKKMAKEFKVGPSDPLAQAIGDTYVMIDNSGLLPLIFISPDQINAQLLSSVTEGEHTLTINTQGQDPISAKFNVKRNAPGVFYNTTEDGIPLIAAMHEDGTFVTLDSPAQRGEKIQFFGTGLGPWNKPILDGFLLPSGEFRVVADPVKVVTQLTQDVAATMDTVPPPVILDPDYAGTAEDMIGTASIKVIITNDVPAGMAELYLNVNGVESNRVQLPVAPKNPQPSSDAIPRSRPTSRR